MSYEGIRITAELSGRVREAVGLRPRRHETLGELVTAITTERGAHDSRTSPPRIRPATRLG